MFVHLHTHFCGSFNDSILRIRPALKKVSEDGQSALAMTEHARMPFIFEFMDICSEYGIKPIIGCEFYFVDDAGIAIMNKQRHRNHLVLIALDNTGISSLIKLNNY